VTPACPATHFRIEGRWNVEAALDSGFPVIASPTLWEDVAEIAARGAMVIGAAGEVGASDVRNSPRHERMILVFGSEARGLDTQWRSLCHATVAIPMQAEVESLNVGAAAAIILWEILRDSRE
jgi:23S rRNA (guanosine2251-2'-O)-methyltransferase